MFHTVKVFKGAQMFTQAEKENRLKIEAFYNFVFSHQGVPGVPVGIGRRMCTVITPRLSQPCR